MGKMGRDGGPALGARVSADGQSPMGEKQRWPQGKADQEGKELEAMTQRRESEVKVMPKPPE